MTRRQGVFTPCTPLLHCSNAHKLTPCSRRLSDRPVHHLPRSARDGLRRPKLLSPSSVALSATISLFFSFVESPLFSVRLISSVSPSALPPSRLHSSYGSANPTSLPSIAPHYPTLAVPPQWLWQRPRQQQAEAPLSSTRLAFSYSPAFITDTARPFAKWELTDMIQLPKEEMKKAGGSGLPVPGSEETMSETVERMVSMSYRSLETSTYPLAPFAATAIVIRWRKGPSGRMILCVGLVRHYSICTVSTTYLLPPTLTLLITCYSSQQLYSARNPPSPPHTLLVFFTRPSSSYTNDEDVL